MTIIYLNTPGYAMAISWYLFVPIYYLLGIIYLLFGVHNKRFIKCMLKCIPIAVLLFQMVTVFIDYASSHNSHHVRYFMWGIAFSAIGDACLVFPTLFAVGMICFGVSLCFYMSAMELNQLVADIGSTGVFCGLCILCLSFSLLILFNRNQMIPVRLKPLAKTVLLVLIVAYFMILSALLWSGTLLLLKRNDIAGVCAAAGAAMFYTSDMLIAASAIWQFRLLQGRALVMITYYSAQLFLAFAIHMQLQDSMQSPGYL